MVEVTGSSPVLPTFLCPTRTPSVKQRLTLHRKVAGTSSMTLVRQNGLSTYVHVLQYVLLEKVAGSCVATTQTSVELLVSLSVLQEA